MVYAVPNPDTSLEDLGRAVDATIAELVAGTIPDSELTRVKNALIAEALARIYGTALTTGGTVEDVAGWPDRIRAVTADDVLAVARKYLVPERSVTGYLRAAPREEAKAPADRS